MRTDQHLLGLGEDQQDAAASQTQQKCYGLGDSIGIAVVPQDAKS